MNINLLPQKFIKNKATQVIATIAGMIFGGLVLVILLFFFFTSMRVKMLKDDLATEQMSMMAQNKQLQALKQEQSEEIQVYLKSVKEKQNLMAPIMKQFQDVSTQNQVVIASYSVIIEKKSLDDTGEAKFSEDGTEVIAVTILARGNMYGKGGKFTEDFAKVDWVYSCKLKNGSVDEQNFGEDNYDFEIELLLAKEKLPFKNRAGGESE